MSTIRVCCPGCEGERYFGKIQAPEYECRRCNATGSIEIDDTRTPQQKLVDRIRNRLTGSDRDEITLDAKEMKLVVEGLS